MNNAAIKLKLLPCPFCGGKAFVDTHRFWDEKAKDFTVQTYGVKCYDCQTGTWQHYRKEEDAIKQWNIRTPMSNIVEKLEERRIEYELSSENAPDDVSSTYRKGVMRGYEYSRDLVKQEINNGLE